MDTENDSVAGQVAALTTVLICVIQSLDAVPAAKLALHLEIERQSLLDNQDQQQHAQQLALLEAFQGLAKAASQARSAAEGQAQGPH